MSEIDPSQVTVVLTTVPDAQTAESLAEQLLDERLVACANVVPGVRSIYRWEGETKHDAEVLVLLKTTTASVPRLTERIAVLHPYDVPEVVALPVTAGLDAYVAWVGDEVGGAHG